MVLYAGPQLMVWALPNKAAKVFSIGAVEIVRAVVIMDLVGSLGRALQRPNLKERKNS